MNLSKISIRFIHKAGLDKQITPKTPEKKDKLTTNPLLINASISSSFHVSEHSSKKVVNDIKGEDKEPYIIIEVYKVKEVIEGQFMINQKLKITKIGLEGSKRKASDGVTYFGQCPKVSL